MNRPLSLSLAMALILGSSMVPALADRAPNSDELRNIEDSLKAAGFIRWDDVELDDGLWEVDDAISADGGKYDLKLDRSFTIVSRDKDD